jgi:hypothetical protein
MAIKNNFKHSSLLNIKLQNKKNTISKLKTGDLVKTKAEDYPLIYHYGIIDKNENGFFILHNHPDKRNSKGGTIVKETFDKWIKGKDIVSVESTNLKTNDIDELYEKLKVYKYDFINFNCEHFVNFAKNNDYVSPQVLRWTTLIGIGIITFYLLRKKI